MTFFDLQAYDRELAAKLFALQFPIRPVAAFLQPAGKMEYPTLEKRFEAPDADFQVISSAAFDGEQVIINTAISASGKDVVVKAPVVAGTLNRNFPINVKELSELAASIRDQPSTFIANAEKFYKNETRFRRTGFSAPDLGDIALFIIEHPITIESAAGGACVIVQSYSPVPLSGGNTLCTLPPPG